MTCKFILIPLGLVMCVFISFTVTQSISNEKCWDFSANSLTCNYKQNENLNEDAPVAHKEFPHIAYIGYGNSTIHWYCLGSLISERYVLIAAHCTRNKRVGNPTKIILGIVDVENISDEDAPQEFDVAEVVVHPQYSKSMYYDVALLRLDKDAQFTDHVRPICLNSDYALKLQQATTVGLDRRSETNKYSLWKSPLSLTPFDACNKTYARLYSKERIYNGISPQTHVCAHSLKDECQKYLEGPLQIYHQKMRCLYTLVGISSFGTICSKQDVPEVYTRVYPFIPWIEVNIWY